MEPAGAHPASSAPARSRARCAAVNFHRRAQRPARPGVRSASPPIAEAAGGDSNRLWGSVGTRPELRRMGAAHRRALRDRPHGGAGGAAGTGCENKRVEVGLTDRRPDRNPRGAPPKATSVVHPPGRGAVARGGCGAGDYRGRGREARSGGALRSSRPDVPANAGRRQKALSRLPCYQPYYLPWR